MQAKIKYLMFMIFFVTILSQTKAQDRVFTLSRQSFAVDLFKNMSVVNSFLISPLSIDIALNAVFFGSSQQTFLELMEGLHYPKNYSMNLIQSNFQLLVRNMRRVNGLEIATKLYIDESLQTQPSYRSTITRVLNSDIEPISFKRKLEAARTMNSWVASKTHNMITDIIDSASITNDMCMVLINCIYFKGSWLYTFSKNKTFTGDFYTDNENTVPADFMTITTAFLYNESIEALGGASAVILPYKNSDMSMLLVLPKEKTGLQDLVKNISNFDWTNIENSMMSTTVIVAMPKFNITFESRIDRNLRDMGMRSIFDPLKASLDRMLSSNSQGLNVNIDSIIHKAVITVDEEGTVAAAVTAAMHKKTLRPYMFLNHPFLFMLRTRREIYFIGQYTRKFYTV